MNARPLRDWAPTATSPGLLVCQLAFLLQAALRGLSYLLGQAQPGTGTGWQWSPHLWGTLLLGLALAVVTACAARTSALMQLGHLLLAALYAGLGALTLSAAVRSGALLAVGVLLGAAGVLLLLHPAVSGPVVRTVAAPTALGLALLTIAAALGPEYPLGTGLTLSAASHAGIAWGLSWHAARQTVEREGTA